jgi:hypothetical protein
MTTLPLFATLDRDLASRYQASVIAYLAQATDWKLRRDICQQFPELNDRSVRRIAELSDGRIVSTDLGYRLVEFVTPIEMGKYQARQFSQMAKTKQRVDRTMKRWIQARKGVAA